MLLLVMISVEMYSQNTPGEYTIKNVITNTKYSDFGTSFFGKDKVIFASPKDNTLLTRKTWSGNNQPFLDLYIGTINERGEIIGKKRVIGDVNNQFHEGIVSFTKDLKTVYFSANNYTDKNKAKRDSKGIVNIQLYKASVKDNGEWHNVVKLPFNDDEFSTGHPALNKDDTELYFISDRPGSIGKTDIYVVQINEDGSYGEPKNLGPKINTEEREMFPFISDDNILYFSSNGHPGYGGLDVFASRIFDTTVTDPINLEDPVNSSNDDFAFIIDDTKHKGYFSSNNRKDGKGDDDIYFFISFPPLKIEGNQVISGVIIDKKTQKVIPNAIVILLDEEGNELQRVDTSTDSNNSNTSITINNLNQNNQNNITVFIGEGKDVKVTKTVDNTNPKVGEEIEFTVEVANTGKGKVKGIKLSDVLPEGYAYVSDDGEKEYQSDTDILNIQSLGKGKTKTIKIKAVRLSPKKEGEFSFDAKSNTNYKLVVEAPGYLREEIDVKTVNDTDVAPLEVDINLAQELRVVDEKIMINIKTIYFDFDKWNIRPEAAKELDKVIAVMKSHPSMVIEAGSHTDSRATEAYNQRLSEKRAKSTVDYIVAGGIDRSRITAKGYGEMQLVNNCSSFVKCTREEHQLNRRTEFVIVNDNDRFASIDATLEDVKVDKKANLTYVDVDGEQTQGQEQQQSANESSGVLWYHIIAGGFRNPKNAVRKLNQLKAKGYKARNLGVNKSGLIQVSFNSYTNKKEALYHLSKIRKIEDKDAWLLIKKVIPTTETSGNIGVEKDSVPKVKTVKDTQSKDLSNNVNIKIPPIYFEFDKWSISDAELKQLDKVVEIMKEHPTMIVEAGAHTDAKNLESYNQILSEKRAQSVVNYIVSKGISRNRIIGKGYGEKKLTNHCKSFVKCTPEEQQANRRTEFKIMRM